MLLWLIETHLPLFGWHYLFVSLLAMGSGPAISQLVILAEHVAAVALEAVHALSGRGGRLLRLNTFHEGVGLLSEVVAHCCLDLALD